MASITSLSNHLWPECGHLSSKAVSLVFHIQVQQPAYNLNDPHVANPNRSVRTEEAFQVRG